jgi:hypothetical protein
MRQMGYVSSIWASVPAKPAVLNHSSFKDGKITLLKVTKSQLVRVTIEEINSIRPSVYKYLLP